MIKGNAENKKVKSNNVLLFITVYRILLNIHD